MITAVRYVCKRKVMFVEGQAPTFYEDCTEIGVSTESWGNPIDNASDYGGWYELNPSGIVFNDDEELKFHGICNRLYSVFANCIRAFRFSKWRGIDLGTWCDDDIDDLVETLRSAVNQVEWPSLTGHQAAFLALLQLARCELGLRRGYDFRKNPNYGFVYLVESTTGHYKIGKSTKPEKRITEFVPSNVLLPIEFTLEHVIECDNYHKFEVMLHAHYASKRVKGEWFSLTENDVNQIKAFTIVITELPPITEAVA